MMLDLNKNEEEILAYWKDKDILKRVREKNKGKKAFYFLDGPPYVSGDLHPGQMWVKSMKDVLVRYKRFRGFDVYDRAGYDVHGLPIERKVEATLNITSKKEIETRIGVENFIKSCKEFVEKYIGRMDADYLRFGISLDFSNPYIPSRNPYMEIAWSTLKRLDEKGLLYKNKRSTTYCTNCETAVSQGSMEVEHRNDIDPAILVQFKINIELSKPRIRIDNNTHLVIWTTTPWTLPSNVAVAVHPKELYVIARVQDKRIILAKSRLDAVVNAIGENTVIEGEFYGSELEDIYYINPLEEKVPHQKKIRKYHKVIFDEDFVNVSEGSGIVHVAPGHGLEDYTVGKKNKLPIFSPVNTTGKYTAEAGAYEGLDVLKDANGRIMADLKEHGALMDEGKIEHSYPHCWRCDTKLIFIATVQWFINIQKIKKKLIKENSKVSWHPGEAQKWQDDLLVNSPDWTISRQRYWGTPMPIWTCENMHTLVVGSLKELKEKATEPSAVEALGDLHRPYIDRIKLRCPSCGKEMSRINDVLDVWFDSAIAFRASLTEEQFKLLFPIDFILEAVEQLRGWFSYQLKIGVAIYGKKPFENIVMHGMMLGQDGREMHKKLGNYVPLDEILKTTTADSFRLWCTSHTPQLDLIFSMEKINEANKVVRLLYNIFNLLEEYSDAIGYKPEGIKKPKKTEDIGSEDLWIISRFNDTIREATTSLDNYDIYKAINPIKKFIIEDLSRFYLKIAKKRIVSSSKKEGKKVIGILNYIFYNILIAISPFAPFSAEKIYTFKYNGSIFLEVWPGFNEKLIDKDLEKDFSAVLEAITAILNSREKANIKLRQPLMSATIELNNENQLTTLQKLVYVIEDYTNIKHIDVKMGAAHGKEVVPSFSAIGPEFRQNAKIVADTLKTADADELMKAISESGHYQLHTPDGPFDIRQGHFSIIERSKKENAIEFSYGIVYVNPEISKGLRDEALIREFERRVQLVRKDMQLKKVDKIVLHYKVPIGFSSIIKENRKGIMKDLGAVEMKENPGLEKAKEFDVEGEKVGIAIRKV